MKCIKCDINELTETLVALNLRIVEILDSDRKNVIVFAFDDSITLERACRFKDQLKETYMVDFYPVGRKVHTCNTAKTVSTTA